MITPRKNRIIMLPNKWALSLNVHWYCLLVNTHICEYNRNGLHDVVLSAAGSVLLTSSSFFNSASSLEFSYAFNISCTLLLSSCCGFSPICASSSSNVLLIFSHDRQKDK